MLGNERSAVTRGGPGPMRTLGDAGRFGTKGRYRWYGGGGALCLRPRGGTTRCSFATGHAARGTGWGHGHGCKCSQPKPLAHPYRGQGPCARGQWAGRPQPLARLNKHMRGTVMFPRTVPACGPGPGTARAPGPALPLSLFNTGPQVGSLNTAGGGRGSLRVYNLSERLRIALPPHRRCS